MFFIKNIINALDLIAPLRGSHGLSAPWAQRTKSSREKGSKLAQRAASQKSGPRGALDF